MQCSHCNYVRKNETSTPEWQCPNCKHVYDLPYQPVHETPEKNKHLSFELSYIKDIIFILIAFAFMIFFANHIDLIYLLLPIFIYFLPTLIASYRKHSSTLSIFTLNLFLGWTLIGWVVSLVWAFKNPEKIVLSPPSSSSSFKELEALARLRDKKIISEEEFILEKNKILGNNAK